MFWTTAAAVAAQAPTKGAVNARPPAEERRILVAFRDGNIGRLPVGDGASSYRRRGPYGTSSWGARSVAALAEQYRMETMAQWPIPVLGMHCAVYRVPMDQSVQQTVDALSRDERVDLAESMRIFHAKGDSSSDPYARLQYPLIHMNVAAVHRYAKGRDVEIAVIDTGIDTLHPDLRDQVVEAKNFTQATNEKIADIHGTAVAGIIAAIAGNRIGIAGMAPEAKILSLKACWPERTNQPESVCDTFTLAQALNAAIERKARVVNLSLAGPRDPLLELLIAKGVAQGIMFVASLPPDRSTDTFPASAPGVVGVRSVGAAPAPPELAERVVTAPGSELLTTLPQGTYNFVSGSSYATAIVSGLMALMLEKHPDLDTRSMVGILQQSGRRQAGPKGGAAESLDACSALAHLDSAVSCPPAPEAIADTPSAPRSPVARL